jgi:hypothetical protein
MGEEDFLEGVAWRQSSATNRLENALKLHSILRQNLLVQPCRALNAMELNPWPETIPAAFPLITGIGLAAEETLIILTAIPLQNLPMRDKFLNGTVRHSTLEHYLPEVRIGFQSVGVALPCSRPTEGGESVSCQTHCTGTIACEVKDTHGDRFLLSCAHVLASSPKPRISFDEIWQPGSLDGGSAKDRLGVLGNYKPIDISKSNLFDAALCKPDKAGNTSPGIKTIGTISGKNTAPKFDQVVTAHGGKSGLTTRTVQLTKLSMSMPFGKGSAIFDDQIGVYGSITGPDFAQNGDSGALVRSKRTGFSLREPNRPHS